MTLTRGPTKQININLTSLLQTFVNSFSIQSTVWDFRSIVLFCIISICHQDFWFFEYSLTDFASETRLHIEFRREQPASQRRVLS